MTHAQGVKDLVQREPWRAGQGRPRNALDPAWTGYFNICAGDIEWEQKTVGGVRWWWCTQCGYCSFWSNVMHYQVEHPESSYERNLRFFYERRMAQGLDLDTAKAQACHVASMALYNAAKLPPEQLGQYIDSHIMLAS